MTVPCPTPDKCGADYHLAGSTAASLCRRSSETPASSPVHVPTVPPQPPSPDESEQFKVSRLEFVTEDDFQGRHPREGVVEDLGLDWSGGGRAPLRLSYDTGSGVTYLVDDRKGEVAVLAVGVGRDQVEQALLESSPRTAAQFLESLEVES